MRARWARGPAPSPASPSLEGGAFSQGEDHGDVGRPGLIGVLRVFSIQQGGARDLFQDFGLRPVTVQHGDM